jgi:TrmH family RNA methyltransferase
MNSSNSWRGTVEMIRRTYTAHGRRQSGRYSIEGTRLVERALRAGIPIEQAVVSRSYANAPDLRVQQLLSDLLSANCPLATAPDEIIAGLTNGRNLGAILALVSLPPPLSIHNLQLTIDNSPFAPLLLAALDITDPGNTGALVRTAHAAGATGLIAVGASDPYHPRAVLTSRGSLFKLPLVHYETAESLLNDLRQHDVLTIGTAAGGGVLLPEARFPERPLAVFMGNEGSGLPEVVTAALDLLVTIPMPPGVDSFAVNAAAAVVLYAARYQTKQNPAD